MSTERTEEFSYFDQCFPFAELPIELWLKTFSYLNIDELKRLRLTCKYFDSLARTPLMNKSKIVISLSNVNRLEFKKDFYPFHTIEICDILLDKDFSNVLDKCATVYLRILVLWNANIFEWFDRDPLINLKELHIEWMGYIDEPIPFAKNWPLKLYRNLETISILFDYFDTDIYPQFLRLLRDAVPSLRLKKLLISYFDVDSLDRNIMEFNNEKRLDYIESPAKLFIKTHPIPVEDNDYYDNFNPCFEGRDFRYFDDYEEGQEGYIRDFECCMF